MEKRDPIGVSPLERKKIRSFLYCYRITDYGFGMILKLPEYEIRRLKGTLAGDNDKPNKSTLEKALKLIDNYVRNPKLRARIPPKYYRKGIKFLVGAGNQRNHLIVVCECNNDSSVVIDNSGVYAGTSIPHINSKTRV